MTKSWNSRFEAADASLDGMRAVLDPRDEEGFKNEFIHRVHTIALARAAAAAGNEPYRTAIDFGCGIGRLTPLLAGLAEHVVGLDVNLGYLERATRDHGGPNATFMPTEECTPVEGPTLVVCFGVLCHFTAEDVHSALVTLRELAGGDAVMLIGERMTRTKDHIPDDLEPRDPEWYAAALRASGWTPRSGRIIRRSYALPLRASVGATGKLPHVLRGPTLEAWSRIEYRRAPRARKGDYVEVCISADAGRA